MKKILAIFFISFVFIPQVLAQTKDAENTISQLASELNTINQKILVYQNPQSLLSLQKYRTNQFTPMAIFTPEKIMSTLLTRIIDEMKNLQEKYKNNPYVSIKGFDITLGTSLSVTLSLEFKK